MQFEVSPAEGVAGHEIQWTGNTFVDPERLGLPSPGELPLVTIAYLIAQKLHACTDHTYPERPNDCYRDLIDLILVDRLMSDEDRAGVREVCVEIFRLRGKHAWPPRITVLSDWPEGYRTLAGQLGFAPADVHQAAIDVHEIIARIDAATRGDLICTLTRPYASYVSTTPTDDGTASPSKPDYEALTA